MISQNYALKDYFRASFERNVKPITPVELDKTRKCRSK